MRLASFDPPLHHGGDVRNHHRRETGRLLELRSKLGHDDFGDPRAKNLKLGVDDARPPAKSSKPANSTVATVPGRFAAFIPTRQT